MDILKSIGFLAAILAFFGGVVLTLLGGGDGAWEAEGIKQAPWPREQVFEWLTEPSRRAQWVEGLVSTTVLTDGRMKAGSRLRETLMLDGETHTRTLEVTEFVDGEVFAYKTVDDGVEFDVHFKVGAYQTSEQSRIDFKYMVQFPGVSAKVLEPVLTHRLRDRIDDEFERFARCVMLGG